MTPPPTAPPPTPAAGVTDRGALRLLAIALTIDAALNSAQELGWRATLLAIQGGSTPADVAWVEQSLRALSWLFPAVAALAAWALVRAFRASADGALRGLLAVAAGTTALLAVHSLLARLSVEWLEAPWRNLVLLSVGLLAHGCVAAALWRHARCHAAGGGVALGALGAVVVDRAFWFAWVLAPEALDGVWTAIGNLAPLALALLPAVLLPVAAFRAVAQAAAGRPSPGLVPPRGGAEWARAARGLRLYRAGLVWKIAVLVVGLLLMVMAAAAQSLPMIKGTMALAALAGLVPSIVMFVGLVRFTAVPDESDAHAAALATVVLWPVGMALDAWALVIIVRMQGARDWDLVEHVETVQQLQPVAQLVGIVSLAVLLTALRRCAQALGEATAAARAGTLWVLAAVLAGGPFLVRAQGLQRALGGAGLLVLALGVLAVLIAFVILYLGLVSRLIHRMQAMESPAPADGPADPPLAPPGGEPA